MRKWRKLLAMLLCVLTITGTAMPVAASGKPEATASTMATRQGEPYLILYNNTPLYNPQTGALIGYIEQHQWILKDYISGNRFYGTVAGGALANLYGFVNRYNVAQYPG